jgi:hypothetical protein
VQNFPFPYPRALCVGFPPLGTQLRNYYHRPTIPSHLREPGRQNYRCCGWQRHDEVVINTKGRQLLELIVCTGVTTTRRYLKLIERKKHTVSQSSSQSYGNSNVTPMTSNFATPASKYKTSLTPVSNFERKMIPPSNWP